MKSISPIVAIVILLLMTVAAAGMAYLTIVTYQSETQSGTQGGLETLGTRTRTQLKIESVSGGKIYLRNLGSETFENPAFYIEGKPLNFTGPEDCEPGKICVYTVLENVTCTGPCELTMGEDMPVGTRISVSEEDLGSGGEGGGEPTPQSLTTFSDSSSEKTLTFSGSGSKNETKIRLPLTATVTSAELDVAGLQTPLMWDMSLASGGGLSNTNYAEYPTIATDSLGNVHVAWRTSYEVLSVYYYDIYYAYWNITTGYWNKSLATDGGLSDISTPESESIYPAIAVDSYDNVHVVWDWTDGGETYYAYWNSTTGYWNKSLATDGGLSNTAYPSHWPAIAIDPSNNVHVAWDENLCCPDDDEIYYAYWNSNTGYWNKSLAAGEGLSVNSGQSRKPSVAADPSGNVHIVWRDQSDGDWEIYYAYWNSTTKFWNKSLASSGGLSDNSVDSDNPSITTDSAGNVHVVWQDLYNYGDYDVYYAYWNATTGYWNKSLAAGNGVSNDESEDSIRPAIATDPYKNVYITWDNYGGSIYYVYWNSTTRFWNMTYGEYPGLMQAEVGGSVADSAIATDSSGRVHLSWDPIGPTIDIFYSPFSRFYPWHPYLDAGSDNDSQWNYTGKYTASQTTPDFAAELNSFLPACNCLGCSIDSSYCNITINVTTQSAGIIQLSNLNIIYT